MGVNSPVLVPLNHRQPLPKGTGETVRVERIEAFRELFNVLDPITTGAPDGQ
jgi:hypothetical protein